MAFKRRIHVYCFKTRTKHVGKKVLLQDSSSHHEYDDIAVGNVYVILIFTIFLLCLFVKRNVTRAEPLCVYVMH